MAAKTYPQKWLLNLLSGLFRAEDLYHASSTASYGRFGHTANLQVKISQSYFLWSANEAYQSELRSTRKKNIRTEMTGRILTFLTKLTLSCISKRAVFKTVTSSIWVRGKDSVFSTVVVNCSKYVCRTFVISLFGGMRSFSSALVASVCFNISCRQTYLSAAMSVIGSSACLVDLLAPSTTATTSVAVSFLALLVLATAGVMMWLISWLELATFRFVVDCDLASSLRELPVFLIPGTTGVVG